MKSVVIGWDIGGANVKAVRLTFAGKDSAPSLGAAGPLSAASLGAAGHDTSAPLEPGRAALSIPAVQVTARPDAVASSAVSEARVVVRPFALWREPDRLAETLADVGVQLGAADAMGITMTAELADCFPNKREGVRFVIDTFRRAFPGAAAWVYGLDGSLHTLETADREPLRFAAANWLATARWIGARVPDALLLDVGSTTTDVVPIVGGRVEALGRTDTERLILGELVYTGILRTPVCALVRRVPLRGGWCRVAAEHFAIAADAHVWLRGITPAEYACETPDGRGTTQSDARRRLARMVCDDDASLTDAEVTGIARGAVRAQRRLIATAVDEVLARLGGSAPTRAVIAGSGHRLAAAAARRARLEPVPLVHRFDNAIAAAAPAAAVAHLLALQIR